MAEQCCAQEVRFGPALLGLVGVLVIAAGVRALHLTTWSLWLDEETTIYHALNPQHIFPRCCPLYFRLISGVYQLSDQYIFWGRAISSLFGVASVWLVFEFCRRNISARVAFIAALLLALNLYHLFWSQSIRYYTMLLTAQLAASIFFVEGVGKQNRARLLSAGALSLASVWIHYTAVFLLPVWIAYLAVLRFLNRINSTTVAWATGLSVVPFVASMLWALPQIKALQASGATGAEISAQALGPLLVKIVFYFGPPIVLLALASAALLRRIPSDGIIFMWLLAILPILEICVIGVLGLANVTIHHAFVSVAGFVTLAANSIMGLAECRRPRLAAAIAAATFAYAIAILWLYFTAMHGDRSRWAEATEILKEHVDVESASTVAIYATEPSIVAHYLGVSPDKTMGSQLVTPAPLEPVPTRASSSWYLVDSVRLTERLRAWLSKNAECLGTFEAQTGPRDRSVSVYHVDGSRKVE